MNYEDDIRIDETALDVEWLNQAELALAYGKNWADKFKEVQQIEERLKVVRAELIKEANESPEECLGTGVKPTAVNIESYYRTHISHIQLKEELVEAQYKLNIAEVAKNEITRTRKAALQNLVVLHGQNYFAGPTMPRNLSEEVVQQQVQSNKKIRMKRKKN